MKRLKKLILLIILALVLYTIWQLWDISRVGHHDDGAVADCAIVLGAAAWHDKPSPVLRERLNHAIKLYRENRVRALILTGGYGDGARFAESEVSRTYCLKEGVPLQALHLENNSQTTLENLKKTQVILRDHNFQKALLVSDPWHLKRAGMMARDLKIDSSPSATQTTRFQSFQARSKFLVNEFLLIHQYWFTEK